MRRHLDAWFLVRALRVFERRGWRDAPGYPTVVGHTMAQLGYRARALRIDQEYR